KRLVLPSHTFEPERTTLHSHFHVPLQLAHQTSDPTFLVTIVEECSARHSSARQIPPRSGHCSFRLRCCLYIFRRVHRFLLLACLSVDIHRLDILWRVCCLLLWSSVEIWPQTPTTSRKTGSKDSVVSPFVSISETLLKPDPLTRICRALSMSYIAKYVFDYGQLESNLCALWNIGSHRPSTQDRVVKRKQTLRAL
ncbi:hypothetical protein D6C77_08868, partial [Aureobasidium pullulans]